ncbi:MAG TPA: lipid-binding SYLF domain-containing protein [Acidobacteriota bacterium]
MLGKFKASRVFGRLSLSLLLCAGVSAGTLRADLKDDTERAQKAAEVLSDVMRTPDRGIPKEILDRAQAIAVIPHVVKGAFGIGGRWGKGLIAKRNANGTWGTPSYVEIGGASVGFQLGVTATDLILVFTESSALKHLMGDRLKLGADAAVAAGPVGRSAEAGVSGSLKSPIYSYSRTKGLFAGVSLDGAGLSIDDSANHNVYGKNVTGRDILDGKVKAQPAVMPFVNALQRNVPRKIS